MRPRGIVGKELLAWMLAQGVRTPSGCLEWPHTRDENGYGRLKVGGRMEKAHRVVCELVHERPAPPEVRHSCDNRPCIEPSHLLFGDHASNTADRVARNRSARPRGRANPKASLSEAQVRAIRADPRTQAAIAAQYGINQTAVSKIKRRASWSHLD